MKKIRILQFLSTAHLAGTELSVLSLVSRMNRERFDLEVCFLYSEGPVTNKFLSQNIKCYHLDYAPANILKVAVKLYKILKIGRYDVIHIYGLKANIIGRLIGRLAGCKNIVAGLESIYPSNEENRLHFILDRLTLPFIKLYISVSKKGVNFLVKKGYPHHIFRVVYRGIDVKRLQVKKDNALLSEFESSGAIITSVARFEWPKDHKTLLLALNILKKKGLEFFCLLIGEGSLKKETLELCDELELKERVCFLGSRNDIPQIFSISDIFLLTSIFEGIPISIMEAMAARLPVVATDVGGISELVDDGKTGFLVPIGDSLAVANKIEKLLLDSSLRVMMGNAGLEKIQKEFSIDRLVNEMEEIYTHLLS
jgi:glycosyltransferase involved in cell wall biosynthesis